MSTPLQITRFWLAVWAVSTRASIAIAARLMADAARNLQGRR